MVSVDSNINQQGLIVDRFSADRRSLTRTLLTNSPIPEAFLPVDFSGDGILDIAVIHTGALGDSTSITYLLGTADGNFIRTTSHPIGGYFDSTAAIQINSDNLLDFSVHTYTRQFNGFFYTSTPRVSRLMNLGNGRFEVQSSTPASFSCASSAVADFDGDGFQDLACAASGGNITISRGLGLNGMASPNVGLAGVAATYLTAADLNKDGRMDLVAAGSGAVHTLLGNGRGTFIRAASRTYTGLDRQLLVEDFDRDGHLDVVIAEGEANALLFFPESYFEVLFGGGDGRLLGQESASFLVPNPAVVPWTGFHSESNSNILALEASGQLSVLESKGDGRLVAVKQMEVLPPGASQTKVVQEDIDGDGLKDLAVLRRDDGLYVARNLGNAQFAKATRLYSCTNCFELSVSDLNRDGQPDLAISGSSRALIIWNEGRMTFRTSAEIAPGIEVGQLIVGDVNFDGFPDLVFARLESAPANVARVSVLAGRASGSFAMPSFIAVDGDISSISLTDANVDGKLEIAIATYSRSDFNFPYRLNLFSYSLGSGFGLLRSVPLPTWFGSNRLNDFDGDRIPDLLLTSFHRWHFAKGRGDFQFDPFIGFAGLPRADYLEVGDVNGDGLLDLLLTTLPFHFGVSNVSVAVNRSLLGLTAVSSASFTPGPIPSGSLFTIFGSKFTNASLANSNVVPPSELGGVSISILDSNSRVSHASMLFVSEQQLNAMMPLGLALGPATLSIQTWFGSTQILNVDISEIQPALFTAGSSGIVAANLLRIGADGRRLVTEVVRAGAQGNLEAVPIEFEGAGEQLYLLLYGTGIRGRLVAPSTRVLINGRSYPVTYAGAQGEFPGLDQVNVLLDSTLSGSGLTEVQIIQTMQRDYRSNVGKISFR